MNQARMYSFCFRAERAEGQTQNKTKQNKTRSDHVRADRVSECRLSTRTVHSSASYGSHGQLVSNVKRVIRRIISFSPSPPDPLPPSCPDSQAPNLARQCFYVCFARWCAQTVRGPDSRVIQHDDWHMERCLNRARVLKSPNRITYCRLRTRRYHIYQYSISPGLAPLVY